MDPIISACAMRQCEQANFDAGTAEPETLMRIAGESCAEIFCEFLTQYPNCRRVVIFAGRGNNGGDGVVMAGVLAGRLTQPVVLALSEPVDRLSECSSYFFRKLSDKVKVCAAGDIELTGSDMVVDALLGTGCRGVMREPYRELIEKINHAQVPVFAVDLPSGLGSDMVVRADITAVIGFFKDLLFSSEGIEKSGMLRRVMLPLTILPENETSLYAADSMFFRKTQRVLSRQVHKYQRGNVLVIGGSKEYCNAPFLTAISALRAGAGFVRAAVPFPVAVTPGLLSTVPVSVPGLEGVWSARSFDALSLLMEKADVIAVGPGMGRAEVSVGFMERLLECPKNMVIDADGIWLAAQLPEKLRSRKYAAILTPHYGEARFLSQAFGIELSGDNIADARMLSEACGATVLLKGARTAVADAAGRVGVNTSGSPTLATAGSGDTLTGLIAAEFAAGASGDAFTAALRGAFLHGMAGEYGALKFGECGVIADDLPELVAQVRCRLAKNQDIFR